MTKKNALLLLFIIIVMSVDMWVTDVA